MYGWRGVADLELQRDLARRRLRFEQLLRFAKNRFDVDARRLNRQLFATFEACDVEEVRDEPAHSFRRNIHDVELLAIFARKRIGHLQQRRAEGYGVEGIAEIVRDDG